MVFNRACISLILLTLFLSLHLPAAQTFRIATYNVENDLDHDSGTRHAKSDAAKAKILESILALKPDVLALEEIGETNVLLELQSALQSNGLPLPNWEYVTGFDTNIHVCVLSRFPITARRPQTNDTYLLNGETFKVSRGFAEVDVAVTTNYSFTLIAAHLKSKRTIRAAAEADMRLEEAKILRQKIDDILAANPNTSLIVLGDLNDTHDSPAIRAIIGRGKTGLVDTRPAEHNGDAEPAANHRLNERNITWTDFYAKEDLYSRIDYILLSHAFARDWNPAETAILALPNWGIASDHRPLVATFTVP
ncbi:MAG TPA: endonuclease/exonuclease/phosphatase family protein [Verrucomicrobiae bacterium]|jgi:endonuclease/exonuclease/phosphatase family metal-dependent hydrolase|nr:endonuclease/exonuclease/phosphatase family protein [Verrucomicrobiae bacterium]